MKRATRSAKITQIHILGQDQHNETLENNLGRGSHCDGHMATQRTAVSCLICSSEQWNWNMLKQQISMANFYGASRPCEPRLTKLILGRGPISRHRCTERGHKPARQKCSRQSLPLSSHSLCCVGTSHLTWQRLLPLEKRHTALAMELLLIMQKSKFLWV